MSIHRSLNTEQVESSEWSLILQSGREETRPLSLDGHTAV